jgi:hypothetical protein
MPAGTYDQFPGIDSENNFAPEVRSAFLASTDVKGAIDSRAGAVADTKVAAATKVRMYQNYRWADAAARTAQTGMRKFDRGVQLDNGQEWQYDGAAWQTYLFAKSALTDIQSLDIPGNYRVASLSTLFNLMNDDSKRPAPGSLIHVGYSLTSGNSQTDYHFGSVWRVVPAGDKAEPLPGSAILLDGNGSLSTLGNLCTSGGAWNSRMTLDHGVSTAILSGLGSWNTRREYRWSNTANSSGYPQWRLWPTANSVSVFAYNGPVDQAMNNGGWTTPNFDTVETDGLFMDYLGTSAGGPKPNYRISEEGRYEIQYRWAPTNSDGSWYLSTVYNQSVGGDEWTTHQGLRADWPVTLTFNRWFYAGNIINAATFNSGGNQNWFRRGQGSTQFNANRLRLFIKYTGWF